MFVDSGGGGFCQDFWYAATCFQMQLESSPPMVCFLESSAGTGAGGHWYAYSIKFFLYREQCAGADLAIGRTAAFEF